MIDKDIEVSEYGIFSDAVATIKTLNNDIETDAATLNECQTKLKNDTVFMGPICDSCTEGFANADIKLATMTANYSTIANYLIQVSSTYKTGDATASNGILTSVGGLLTTASTTSNVKTGNTNQDTIYNFLASKGFNNAAISGILANIQYESNFDPHALGDNGTSYGICQWHKGRWESLKKYCSQNGLDSTTIEGQLNYLVYELENNFSSVYNKVKNVPNTQQGAYDAAYEWTVHFEVPANKEQSGQRRGNTAMSTYWSTYSDANVSST